MEYHDPGQTRWFKATASDHGQGCVEVAFIGDGARGGVALRDSKALGRPAHLFTAHAWACFIDGAKNGEFDI